MKYARPLYAKETVETRDVICESPFDIVHTEKVVGTDEEGKAITAPATQIIVDIGNLL